nr:DUF642 domain-containing protein [uncultured Roseateles sp.]
MRTLLSLAAALCAALAPSWAQANLLTNGSFEQGSFSGGSYGYPLGQQLGAGSTAMTGWTVGAPEVAWAKTGQANLTAADGDYFVDLTGFCDLAFNGSGYCGGGVAAGSYGSVTQQLATVAGATYRLSFDGGTYGVNSAAPTLVASAGATAHSYLLPSSAPNTGLWVSHSFDFMATASSTAITFGGSGGAYGLTYYLGVDHVSVELLSLPVPEPASWALMLGGLALLGTASARRMVRQ